MPIQTRVIPIETRLRVAATGPFSLLGFAACFAMLVGLLMLRAVS